MRIKPLLLVGVALLLGGCAQVHPQTAFDDVETTLAERAPERAVWRTGADEDAEADRAVDSLLAASLTLEAAVQIALLENRRLQATYETLGVAQADLVQAGLLANPVFGGAALWPLSDDHTPALHLSLATSFLDLLVRPLRRAVASEAYEAARLRVAEAVLMHAAETRAAFYRAQTADAQAELLRTVERNAAAAYEAAVLLREAGNVPALDVLAEQARYERVRLDRIAAGAQAQIAHERLAEALGVFGERAGFSLAGPLAPVPDAARSVADTTLGHLEADAVAASLSLAAARHDVLMRARRLGAERPERLLPDLELGAEAEREDGDWKLGPFVHLAIPLFDQGQARWARGEAELREAQARYYAEGVAVRLAARVAAAKLSAAERIARHYQNVLLPLHAELTAATLRQYNAMQTGVFGLLQAQQSELDASRRYLAALADYWQARTDVALLRQGGMPRATTPTMVTPGAASSAPPDAH